MQPTSPPASQQRAPRPMGPGQVQGMRTMGGMNPGFRPAMGPGMGANPQRPLVQTGQSVFQGQPGMGAPVQPGPGQTPVGSQSGFRPDQSLQPLQPSGMQQPAIQQQRNPLSPTIANARPLSPPGNNMSIHQFNNNSIAVPSQPRPIGPPMGAPGNLGPQSHAPTGRRAYPSQPPPQQPMPQMGPQGVPGPGFNLQQNSYGQQLNMGSPGSQPGQPQQYVQPAVVPQFGEPKPGPPQFGGPARSVQPGYGTQPQPGPAYGQPPGPGFQPVGPPAFVRQLQPQSGFPGGPPMNQLQNRMQNMNMGSGSMPRNPAAPTAVNLLQKPPSISNLDTMLPPPSMAATQSVSQSPHSLCPPSYKRCTMTAIPQTQPVLAKCKIPLGLIVTPYRTLQPGEEPVPVVNPPQIVRCRRCRAYINPWVQFVEQGTRWKCNMCFLTNEVPGFFDWDGEARQQVDRMKRPELTHSVVEYIAPQEYMVRPPQPVVLLFLLDVTYPAVQSGMLEAVCMSIMGCLDDFPNVDGRTKVGFIAVDSALHFFNLNSGLADPEMLVVADIEDTFIPLPEDLLVPFNDSRLVIEKLLAGLPNMFRGATATQNCLGCALQAAFKMISAMGGKIVVCQSSLPNLSEGALKPREDPKVLGTPKEVTLLQPQSPWYKSFAVDCSRTQISVDLFAFNSQYLDLATIGSLAKVTGGANYYYPTFDPANSQDLTKLSAEFKNYFSRPLALEAVLRVRASKGLKMSRFHGNFFLRSTDLLALPTVDPDNSYAIEMEIQDPLPSAVACFQTALLHTSSSGERRIRVLTLTVPVTDSLGELYTGADEYAIATLLSKKAVEKCLTSNLDSARDELVSRLTDLIGAYKNAFTSSGQNSMLILPQNLANLPLLVMSLLKHDSLRTGGGIVPSDVRSFAQALLCVYSVEAFVPAVHARFWALHNMDATCGTLEETSGAVIFPPLLNLSSEKLERHGIYLLENGAEVLVWVGRAVSKEICALLFGVQAYDQIAFGKNALPQLPNELSKRVNNLIGRIQEMRTLMTTTHPILYIVKEDGDPLLRMRFLRQLIEDKLDSGNSYPLFLGYLREKMAKPASMF